MIFSQKDQEERLINLRSSEEYLIFEHFTARFYLIDAHKFGGLFLAYEEDYETNHAQLIIFNGEYNENHMTRLAAICKKKGLHVIVAKDREIISKEIERNDPKKR